MLAIVIVAAIVTVFLVLRPILNRVVRWESDKRWERVLSNPDSDDVFEYSFQIVSFTDAVASVLKPLRVNFTKFMSNLIYLVQGGNDARLKTDPLMRRYRVRTRSIHKFGSFKRRPLGMPIWFMAAFPDVVDWINSGTLEKNCVLYEGIEEDLLESVLEDWRESSEKTQVMRKMVENYLRKVKPYLETQ